MWVCFSHMQLLREFSKPVTDWGPAEDEHRTEFLQGICERTLGYVPSDIKPPDDIEGGGAGEGDNVEEERVPQINASQVWSTGVGGSTAAIRSVASCQALQSLINEGEFYQSKLSIAEKMAELYTKDLVKQGVPVELLASSDRVSYFLLCTVHSYKPILRDYMYFDLILDEEMP